MKNVIPGEVYAIPLFLTDIHPMTRVSLKDLRGDDKKFAYCRIIEDRGSGGILVEVFNKVGTLDISIEEVVESMRLFPPVIITPLGIRKGRWRRIGKQENYNKEQDSMYSDCFFLKFARLMLFNLTPVAVEVRLRKASKDSFSTSKVPR